MNVFKKAVIDKSQRAQTLKNYRIYVNWYAKACGELNQEITDYNTNVDVFIAQNNLQQNAIKHRQHFATTYDSYCCKLSISAYNDRVDAYNKMLKMPIVPKKLHIPIKQQHEETFETLLFFYSIQLRKCNQILEDAGATTTRPLQALKVSSRFLEKYTIQGIKRLRYTEKTIRNHIGRLRDAGVLCNYHFRGSGKPVEYFINPSVLDVFDAKSQKNHIPNNQFFIPEQRKNLPNKDVVPVEEFKNKYKIKNVYKHSEKGEPTALAQLIAVTYGNDFYKNTPNQSIPTDKLSKKILKKINISPGATSEERMPANDDMDQKKYGYSPYLQEQTKDSTELCQNLAAHTYDNYVFKEDLRRLEKETRSGSLIREEFRLFLIQEFLKIAAGIWSEKEVFTGSWINAYNLLNENYFINNNGSIPNKVKLLYQFNNLIYRINWAKKYYKKHPEFKPLYPSQYFDPTRKEKHSGGFGYTLKKLVKHQEYLAKKQDRKVEATQKAKKRNRKYTIQQKVENEVRKYIRGRVSLAQLQDYVLENKHIPDYFIGRLPYYIEKVNNRRFFN